MKNKLKYVLFIILSAINSCAQEEQINYPSTDLTRSALIPLPAHMEATHSGFGLRESSEIIVRSADTSWNQLAGFLSQKIQTITSSDFHQNASDTKSKSTIILQQTAGHNPLSESYKMDIENRQLTIASSTAAGVFRGIQTLLQLIPMQSNDTLTDEPLWVVPSGIITDTPNFSYRGMMLDVARHFFSVDDVKRLIDIMAYYKYNTLHLHLSDDQGWRIEIKSWPKLTTVGGASEVGGGSGGYYTQEDFREIVRYAASQYIQIVPEIDMPGHTNAASLSYPILNGNGKTISRYTGMRVGFSTLNTRSEEVYRFLDDVIREISTMSPGPFFHIGGDESLVTQKDDYIYFVNRVQKIVRKYGKRMIGWNEIAQASLDSSSVVQFWSKENQTLLAARHGAKVIMSPSKKAYLDMKYNKQSKHGLTWSGFITLHTAYNWIPEHYIPELHRESILGIEAPLWSETIENRHEMDYLAFPRAIAYAELGWSPQKIRKWEHFRSRLAAQKTYLDRQDIRYYKSPSIPWGQSD